MSFYQGTELLAGDLVPTHEGGLWHLRYFPRVSFFPAQFTAMMHAHWRISGVVGCNLFKMAGDDVRLLTRFCFRSTLMLVHIKYVLVLFSWSMQMSCLCFKWFRLVVTHWAYCKLMFMFPIQSSCRSSWFARNGWERFCYHSSVLAWRHLNFELGGASIWSTTQPSTSAEWSNMIADWAVGSMVGVFVEGSWRMWSQVLHVRVLIGPPGSLQLHSFA
jgi:hypothetical protein